MATLFFYIIFWLHYFSNRQKIAKLAGVAPLNNDSGQSIGKRKTAGGRSGVRRTLYMATLVATQFNPRIREFYQRLLAKGKLKKVAITAAMRKLLTILNTNDSRTGATVGEDLGIVKTFAGIVAVLCVAFAVMAFFSFQLPWSKKATPSGNAPQPQMPARVEVVQPAATIPEQPIKADAAAVPERQKYNATADAMKLFQGEWLCIGTEGGGKSFSDDFTKTEDRRVTIQGDQMTMARTRGERQNYIGKFEIDASNGHFDFVGTGPDQAPNHWIGIYELNGDVLKLCYRKKSNEDAVRPTEFKTDNDTVNFRMYLTFKRVENR